MVCINQINHTQHKEDVVEYLIQVGFLDCRCY